jgi:hypothetical protein
LPPAKRFGHGLEIKDSGPMIRYKKFLWNSSYQHIDTSLLADLCEQYWGALPFLQPLKPSTVAVIMGVLVQDIRPTKNSGWTQLQGVAPKR